MGEVSGKSQGLSASLALRTPCPPWQRRGQCVNFAGSRLSWSCRCTARWKAPPFIGSCTCSLAPARGALAAGRAGRRRSPGSAHWTQYRVGGSGGGGPAPGAPGGDWSVGWQSAMDSSPQFFFTMKLEGVPLPVPANARERDAGRSGKALVTIILRSAVI